MAGHGTRWSIVTTLFLLACGSDAKEPRSEGGPRMFEVLSATFVHDGGYTHVGLFDYENACGSESHPDSRMFFFMLEEVLATGSHTPSINSFRTYDTNCAIRQRFEARSGTVEVTAVTPTTLSGHFELFDLVDYTDQVFGESSEGTLRGSFDATVCPEGVYPACP